MELIRSHSLLMLQQFIEPRLRSSAASSRKESAAGSEDSNRSLTGYVWLQAAKSVCSTSETINLAAILF
jgi:hypothetical protein